MTKERDFSETFEICNDFTPSSLKKIIQEGIEQGKIFPVNLEKAILKDPSKGYQFNVELKLGDKRKLVTFEYQKKELVEGSGIYRGMYTSIPVGTLDISLYEFDELGFELD